MIKQTAIKVEDTIYTGRGHGTVGMFAFETCQDVDLVKNSVYGFTDEEGKFFDRNEAYDEALKCGQITEEKTNRNIGLFSEDLWEELDPTKKIFLKFSRITKKEI